MFTGNYVLSNKTIHDMSILTVPFPLLFSIVSIGPEDDDPRSLDVLEFICHSPRSSSFSSSSQYDIDLLNLWIAPKPISNIK